MDLLLHIKRSGLISAEEIGAYVRLLIHHRVYKRLPADPEKIRQIAGISAERWPAVRKSLLPLFKRNNGRYGDHVVPILPERSEPPVPCSRETVEAVIQKWREILPELPEPVVITDARVSKFRERWAEASKIATSSGDGYSNEADGIKWWEGLFRYIRQSDFLMGKKIEFRAHFDFILQASSFQKLIDGVYHKSR